MTEPKAAQMTACAEAGCNDHAWWTTGKAFRWDHPRVGRYCGREVVIPFGRGEVRLLIGRVASWRVCHKGHAMTSSSDRYLP